MHINYTSQQTQRALTDTYCMFWNKCHDNHLSIKVVCNWCRKCFLWIVVSHLVPSHVKPYRLFHTLTSVICPLTLRIFHKVKSRSAHMKSHSEQEKKAAALRLREEEERATAAAALAAAELARKRAGEAAAAVAAAQNGRGEEDEAEDDEEKGERRGRRREQVDNSSAGESSETAEDENDEDWQ